MAYIPPTDWEMRDFYREHADMVYRSCVLFTEGRADAQAMTKEIFLKLLDRGMVFSSAEDARAWMILSAYKMRKKAVRAAKKRLTGETVPEKPAVPLDPEPAVEVTSEEKLPQTEVSETDEGNEDRNDSPEVVPDAIPTGPDASTEPEADSGEVSSPEEVPAETASAGETPSEEVPHNETPEISPPEAVPSQDAPNPGRSEPGIPGYGPEVLTLSARDRLIALMYYCEGFRKTEIAACLGVTTFMIRTALKRINRLVTGKHGGGLPRRIVKDSYLMVEFACEQKEAVMEELVEQRLKTTDRPGKKWKPIGQWGCWTAILILLAAICVSLYFTADHFGLVDMVREKTEEIKGKLDEIAPADTTLPTVSEPTDETQPPSQKPEDATAAYGDVVTRYVQAIEEDWDPTRCDQEDISILTFFLESPESLLFALMDLDGNGIQELILTDGRVIYDLYTYSGDNVVHVLSGAERNSYMLTADNILINYGSGGAANSVYGFYRFVAETLVVDRLVVLDAGKDPQNPWFHGFIQEDLKPISEAEAQQIIDSYVIVPIAGTPITNWD